MRKSCTVQALGLLLALWSTGMGPAASAGEGASTRRTVTWFANNPHERARVQLACLDDPGRLGKTPDCINAHQASVSVALRSARSRTGGLDPRKPAFWSASPEARRSQLLMCRRNPRLDHCDAAKRSLQQEAGPVGR